MTERSIKRTIKRLRKQNKDKFHPCTISINAMCDKHPDHPEYERLIKNRITRLMEEDEDACEHFYLSEDLVDIRMDEEGVCLAFDILTAYFDDDAVLHLYRYLRGLNKAGRLQHTLVRSLEQMTNTQLADMRKAAEANPEADALPYVEAEERRRKLKVV